LVAGFLLASCSTPSVKEIELTDPRISLGPHAEFFWVNDNELLVGNNDLSPIRNAAHALYGIDVVTGEVHERAQIEPTRAVCFGAGTVLYKKKGGNYYSFGKLGEEKEDAKVSEGISKGGVDRARCRNVDRSPYPPWPSKIVPLLEQHGVLELRYRFNSQRQILGSDAELYLWKPGAQSPLLIPGLNAVDAQSMSNGDAHYVPFKGAYFVVGGFPTRAWWLYPDGHTEMVEVPQDFSNRSVRAAAEPTKGGMLMKVSPYLSARRSGVPDQMYLFRRGRARELIYRNDLINRFVVSPNGCKLALSARGASSDYKDPFRIRVVDLCRE